LNVEVVFIFIFLTFASIHSIHILVNALWLSKSSLTQARQGRHCYFHPKVF
jgi:hypothetical protein